MLWMLKPISCVILYTSIIVFIQSSTQKTTRPQSQEYFSLEDLLFGQRQTQGDVRRGKRMKRRRKKTTKVVHSDAYIHRLRLKGNRGANGFNGSWTRSSSKQHTKKEPAKEKFSWGLYAAWSWEEISTRIGKNDVWPWKRPNKVQKIGFSI